MLLYSLDESVYLVVVFTFTCFRSRQSNRKHTCNGHIYNLVNCNHCHYRVVTHCKCSNAYSLSLYLSPLCLLLCASIIVLLRAHNFRTRAEFDFYFYCQFSLWCDVFQQLFHLNPVNVIRFSVTNNQLTITNYTKIHCVHSSDNYTQIMVSEMGGMHECVILFFFSLLFNSLAPKTNINSMRIAFCKWPEYLIALFYLVRNWTISPVSLQSTRYVDSS